jgi:Protein of unknown function (DUF2958)
VDTTGYNFALDARRSRRDSAPTMATKTESKPSRSPEGGMLLVTDAIRRTLPPLDFEVDPETAIAIVKFFAPVGAATWWVINGGPGKHFGHDDDFVMNAVVSWDGQTYGIGPISQRELEGIKLPRGLHIERDVNWQPRPVKEIIAGLEYDP